MSLDLLLKFLAPSILVYFLVYIFFSFVLLNKFKIKIKSITTITIFVYFVMTNLAAIYIVEDFQEKSDNSRTVFATAYALSMQLLNHELVQETTNEADPLYLKLIDLQKSWLENNITISDIYTMRRNQKGEWYFLVDSETDYNRDGIYDNERESRTAIGEVYDKNLPELPMAWAGESSFTKKPYEDRWGYWISSFSPIYNTRGEVDAVLGVDFAASVYFSDLINIFNIVLLLFMIIGLVLIYTIKIYIESKNANNQLEIALEEAKESASEKSRFTAVVSHEIRTPLNGIIGIIDLIRVNKKNLTDQNIDILNTSSKNLLNLVNDVLTHSALEAKRLEVENVDVNIVHMIQDSIKLSSLMAKQKNISLNFVNKLTDAVWVQCDSAKLQRVFTNLFNNAIKFTHQGSVTAIIDGQLKMDKYDLKISVIDTGIGMSRETINKLFSPYSQGRNDISRKYGGTGLGLSISKAIVELMGGSITVTSKEEVGTQFVVSLVLNKSEHNVKIEKMALLQSSDSSLSNLKILIVDDILINRLVVKQLIESLGLQFTLVESGEMAIQAVQNDKFDLVLMDIHMPEMSGDMAIKKIRELSGQITQPWIVALSASDESNDKEKCLIAGVDDYVLKPITIDKLHELLLNFNKNKKYRNEVA